MGDKLGGLDSIVLIGPLCVGKSSIAGKLYSKYDLEIIYIDEILREYAMQKKR